MTHNVDRFFAAVSVLAGDGHIKQRLIKAYQNHLLDIEDHELPIALREPFAELRRRMHRVQPLNGEGPIRASVRKMSAVEASDCAVQMVTLYGELQRLADNMPTVLPINQPVTTQVPPFLVKTVS